MSQVPTRFTSGVTPDSPNQPLANCGAGNPAFYHEIFSDFDDPSELVAGGLFAVTKSSTGTAALSPNDGGAVVLTTANTGGDYVIISPENASFLLESGKKQFVYSRFKTSSSLVLILLGFLDSTTAPTNTLTIALGTGTLAIESIATSPSSATSRVSTPFTISPNTEYDLCLELLSNGDVFATIGTNLIGQNNGTILAQIRLPSPVLSDVVLSPFFQITSGDTSTPTATVDFLYASKER